MKNGAGGTVLARVVRVGFATFKGQIIRSILLPKPTQFYLFQDSKKFFLSKIFLISIRSLPEITHPFKLGLATVMFIAYCTRIYKMV